MTATETKSVPICGPFDPGGQPPLPPEGTFQIGLFAFNVSSGATMSTAVNDDPDGSRDIWKWPNMEQHVQLAEKVGLDFALPFGRWIGHGGEIAFNDTSMDVTTTCAALGAVTDTIALYGTTHVTYGIHPMQVAKMGACIDQISQGRWGLNVVTGWYPEEMDLFNPDDHPEHDLKYEIADEFVTYLKAAWTAEEPFDFDGRFFKSKGAFLAPKPAASPRPPFVNAGQSPAGIDFATKNCEYLFMAANPQDLTKTTEQIKKVKDRAAHHGREIRCLAPIYVIVRETKEEADRVAEHVRAHIDIAAAEGFIGHSLSDPKQSMADYGTGSMDLSLAKKIALGLRAPELIGSHQDIIDAMVGLKKAGLDGVAMSVFNYRDDIEEFGRLMPALRKALAEA
ncbi:MAG: LLM class flavin-dependent oxidoreductase [Pseudomonadota bacterium]